MSSERDVRLSDIIRDLGALAFDDGHWTALLDDLTAVFGATGASFEVIDRRSMQPMTLECSSGLGDVPAREYVEYYGRISPRIGFLQGKPAGAVSYDYLFFSDEQIDADEFYADFMAPQGMRYFVAGHVHRSPSHEAVVSVHRSAQQGHVGAEEVARMHRLVPHLQRAVDLHFRLAAARSRSDTALDGLDRLDHACFVVDRAGNVLHLNAAARALVADGDGVDVTRGRLTFGERGQRGDVAQRLGHAGPEGADFPVRRPSGKRPFVAAIRALDTQNPFAQVMFPAAALVFVRDPEHLQRISEPVLRESFGLTPTQAAVAIAFDAGLSLGEIAARRGVSMATARSHLYALMAKLNVRTQRELAAILALVPEPVYLTVAPAPASRAPRTIVRGARRGA